MIISEMPIHLLLAMKHSTTVFISTLNCLRPFADSICFKIRYDTFLKKIEKSFWIFLWWERSCSVLLALQLAILVFFIYGQLSFHCV